MVEQKILKSYRDQHPMIPENTHVGLAVHFVHMENWECYDMYQYIPTGWAKKNPHCFSDLITL